MARPDVLTRRAAYPRSPWYLPRRLSRCQASAPARRYRGCLHFVVRLDQDPREHPQGHLRGCLQHIRLPYAQPVEGDQADSQPSGGVRGYPERWQALCQLRCCLRVMLTQPEWNFGASVDLYLHGLRQRHRLRRSGLSKICLNQFDDLIMNNSLKSPRGECVVPEFL